MSSLLQPRGSRAILVFAAPAELECQRRRWPRAFASLFNRLSLASFAAEDTDVHLFSPFDLPSAAPCQLHPQRGHSFAQRLEAAVATLSDAGYEKIVIIGSDCPSLSASDIHRAFSLLDHNRLVLGPDHRGGCYLIALHSADRDLLAGVRWQRNTDFAQLASRARAAVARLEVKQDLDSLDDLRLLARSSISCSALASQLLQLVDAVFRLISSLREFLPQFTPAPLFQRPPPPLFQ